MGLTSWIECKNLKNSLLTALVFLFYLSSGIGLPTTSKNTSNLFNTNNLKKTSILVLGSGSPKYLKTTATGNGSGTDWDNALGASDLQTTLEAGGVVYIAAGVYTPGAEINISNNLCVRGGYPSSITGDDVCDYDPILNQTIIDGQSNHRLFENNSYTDSLEFRGLVLQNGVGGSTGGSAFFSPVSTSNPIDYKFIDVVFDNNTQGLGGALAINSKTSPTAKILVQNCLFNQNTSDRGGGIYLSNVKNSTSNSDPNNGYFVIEDCTFSNNTATQSGGGAINFQNSNQWTIRRNTFCNNNASGQAGGAIRFFSSYTHDIISCDFTLNTANSDGGGIYAQGAKITVDNSNFVNNSSDSEQQGGAIYGAGTSGIDITNSGFYSNTAGAGGAIYWPSTFSSGVANTMDNCILDSNMALLESSISTGGGGALKVINGEWLVQNSFFINNEVQSGSFGGAINVYNTEVELFNNLFFGNLKGVDDDVPGADIQAYNSGSKFTPMANNKVQLDAASTYVVQSGSTQADNYDFTNDTFLNTDDGSLSTAPSISCSSNIAQPLPVSGVECLTTNTCACPPGATSFATILEGHVVPNGAVHCLTGSTTLNNTSNNMSLNGTLYIVDGAVLTLDGNYFSGPNGKIVVCENSGFEASNISNSPTTNFHNFGWMQVCGSFLNVDSIYVGENSLTALKSAHLNTEEFFYQGTTENAYLFLDPSFINGSNTGNTCIPGGTPEMIVEITGSHIPTCVTDCDGCPELTSITETCVDGSVEAAYNSIFNPIEICGNGIDDDGDGLIDGDDLDCTTTDNCGCPSGSTSFTTIPVGHTVPSGEIHCLTESANIGILNTSNNMVLNGSLYIIDGAVLRITGGYTEGPNGKIVVCEGSGFENTNFTNVQTANLYNFGWMQICGIDNNQDSINVGENSLTALKGSSLAIDEFFYQGDTETAYIFLDPTTSLNGASSGNVCIPGGTSEMVVEVFGAINPTCVTDCNGCPELASITQTCFDGSVETAYNAINPTQVCNYTCPGTTGCTYLITGPDANDYNVNSGEKICLEAGANYTGEIGLYGGTIQNCATAPQTFSYFIDAGSPPSTFNNYGTFVATGNIPIQDELTINNYATLSLFNLNVSINAVFNNFCTVDVSNSIYIAATGTLNNYGCMDANLNLTLEPNANRTLSGGCITATQMFNEGTITGVNCGNITISGNSNNTANGSLLGDIGFIDLSPPSSPPFIDTNNGTVGGNVVWASCTSCSSCSTTPEICDNGIDDDGDGLVDCIDDDCCCAQAPTLSK